MSDSLGARLRRRREEEGIALTTIAEDTKIKISLLEALERDDVTRWPSGIFRRAFIRAYAQAIGLDPDTVVREFLEAYPDPEETLAAVANAAAPESAEEQAASARLRHIMGSALESLSRLRRGAVVAPPLLRSGSSEEVTCAEQPVPAEPRPVASEGTPEERPPATAPDAVAQQVTEARAETIQQRAEETVSEAVDERAAEPISSTAEEPAEVTSMPAPEPAAVVTGPQPAPVDVDYAAIAQLCTKFARVDSVEQLPALLGEAVGVLGATGVLVWTRESASELEPTLAYGYSQKVLAQLPTVSATDDNATAAAFRSAQVCAVRGVAEASGALAVPLPSPDGCTGVLALELEHGREQSPSVRAAATILAAALAQLIAEPGAPEPASEPVVMSVDEVPPAPPPLRVMVRR